MTFRHPIHNKVLKVLSAINAEFFKDCSVLFGGGTMLALEYGEHRLSRDIDFLCPYGAAFSKLRRGVFDHSYQALFIPEKCNDITFPREMRTDRDGIRFAIKIDETILKFEIVAEGRISLDTPTQPAWAPVVCLSLVDQITEKLLANGDRWADAAVDSRDLIDLAILRQETDFPPAAMVKAEAAYPTVEPLKRSIQAFYDKPDYRLRCYDRLQVAFPSAVIDGLDLLAKQLDLPLCTRQFAEIKQVW